MCSLWAFADETLLSLPGFLWMGATSNTSLHSGTFLSTWEHFILNKRSWFAWRELLASDFITWDEMEMFFYMICLSCSLSFADATKYNITYSNNLCTFEIHFCLHASCTCTELQFCSFEKMFLLKQQQHKKNPLLFLQIEASSISVDRWQVARLIAPKKRCLQCGERSLKVGPLWFCFVCLTETLWLSLKPLYVYPMKWHRMTGLNLLFTLE